MEQVHGVDVSWMTQGSPKDKLNKSSSPPKSSSQPRQIPTSSPTPSATQQKADAKNGHANGHPNGQPEPSPSNNSGNGSSITRRLSRSSSIEKQNGPNGTPPGRRNSWFSNISAKLSGSSSCPAANNAAQSPSNQTQQSPPSQQQQQQQQQQGQAQKGNPQSLPHHPYPQAQQPAAEPAAEPVVPKISPSRNAVLQHASKSDGNGPYTPAPPKSGQAGFLGVFRRLSSSNHNGLGPAGRLGHGLVERRILNVDQNRERCPISELKGAKLRRVAFCVDVEIAPMPKYSDGEVQPLPIEKAEKKKLTEKGEGEALKHPKAAEAAKEEETPKEQPNATTPAADSQTNGAKPANGAAKDPKDPKESPTASPVGSPEISPTDDQQNDAGAKAKESRKKEKKKRSEEERKARKEKRRRLAEDNGTIPMEIHYDSSDSSTDTLENGSPPKTSSAPTTNPVRIYRRCCQLRETPILKKITEQLSDPNNVSGGIVTKLDLTGYWLQLADLVTLGDYLAVVPVRQVILENIGLTDEGLRVVLAGILASKQSDSRRRKPRHVLEPQGGVVERLVVKNNKLGPDGWKHLALFIYLCRSLKHLDISHIPFPRQAVAQQNGSLPNGQQIPRGVADIFGTALAERLGGSTLEMINMGETEASMDQLGIIMDGIIKCKVRRLGLAHNYLDEQGVAHVSRYLAAGVCEGLDLGGNDLREHMETIASSLSEEHPLWALSLAGCNLDPSSICKILPVLVKLEGFRFIDLSHNHDLFQSRPSAVGVLRRYLPKLKSLKRMHLQDVNMNSEQAIALVEVVPEVRQLAHINLLENAELVKLANAKTEEAQEEACALYASLMAAARVSKSIICVDIEVPGAEAGEIVKAMAKQVVAYCLRNMEQIPDTDIGAAVAAAMSDGQADKDDCKPAAYNDVLMHLVGHDVMDHSDVDGDNDSAPDEDYVIGGTGVVKALKCCLENRGGDESRRQSGEFMGDMESGRSSPRPRLPAGGRAKDMSKHLLAGARKIRQRLQPALNKAQANPGDEMNLRKLVFLDETLQGIIKRFEDEYPDTREAEPETGKRATKTRADSAAEEPAPGTQAMEDSGAVLSDAEDDSEIHPPKALSRSNSMLSRTLAEEEGRVHRAGHRFRSGVIRQEQIDLVKTIDDIGTDPKHTRLLTELAEDIGGDFLEQVKEKGAVRAFKENKDSLMQNMRGIDPDTIYWERFVEAQKKALANISLPSGEKPRETVQAGDESAIAD